VINKLGLENEEDIDNYLSMQHNVNLPGNTNRELDFNENLLPMLKKD
jgi:hypothetical protein